MADEPIRDRHQSHSFVTEKDIDPEFGLFTEETQQGAVPEASETLLKQYPHDYAAARADDELDNEVDKAEEISEELAAVPDADAIAVDSPVDPASIVEEFHGTDLLNGVGKYPEEETEEL
ncbi:hypothetical protein FHS15_004655 [Paenibacillus castaneae]|uniref:hypothetical protein n=1 Tax=Paenibacillus castaneae TaxID=474957 RepID=UPI000C999513|nr:hypothetical protein [Paenibacillus castaneae]NIK79495.1 hypothetical protein [Paenibacillus castaneae]